MYVLLRDYTGRVGVFQIVRVVSCILLCYSSFLACLVMVTRPPLGRALGNVCERAGW